MVQGNQQLADTQVSLCVGLQGISVGVHYRRVDPGHCQYSGNQGQHQQPHQILARRNRRQESINKDAFNENFQTGQISVKMANRTYDRTVVVINDLSRILYYKEVFNLAREVSI